VSRDDIEDRLTAARAVLRYLMHHEMVAPLDNSAVLRGVDAVLGDVVPAAICRIDPTKPRRWTETSTTAAIDAAFAEADGLSTVGP
jgi:hypothetical protein